MIKKVFKFLNDVLGMPYYLVLNTLKGMVFAVNKTIKGFMETSLDAVMNNNKESKLDQDGIEASTMELFISTLLRRSITFTRLVKLFTIFTVKSAVRIAKYIIIFISNYLNKNKSIFSSVCFSFIFS